MPQNLSVCGRMTTRLHQFWRPGNKQIRVFLPNFWMKIVKPPENRGRIPPNMVLFGISPQMTRHDVWEYLIKVYDKLPVRSVHTFVKQGEIEYTNQDRTFRRALDKQPDEKFAWVTLSRDCYFRYPDLFLEMDKRNKERNRLRHSGDRSGHIKRRQGLPDDATSWFEI